jgi:hypothetical protein
MLCPFVIPGQVCAEFGLNYDDQLETIYHVKRNKNYAHRWRYSRNLTFYHIGDDAYPVDLSPVYVPKGAWHRADLAVASFAYLDNPIVLVYERANAAVRSYIYEDVYLIAVPWVMLGDETKFIQDLESYTLNNITALAELRETAFKGIPAMQLSMARSTATVCTGRAFRALLDHYSTYDRR